MGIRNLFQVVPQGKVPPAMSLAGFTRAEQVLWWQTACAGSSSAGSGLIVYLTGGSCSPSTGDDHPGRYLQAETKPLSCASQDIDAGPHVPDIFLLMPSLSKRARVPPLFMSWIWA